MPTNDDIQAAIDSFDMDSARNLLRDALKNSPDAQTYYLASVAAISESQRVGFLKKAVDLDPFHADALKELERLDGAPARNALQVPSTPSVPTAAPVAVRQPQPQVADSTPASADFVKGIVTGAASDVSLYTIPFAAEDNRRTTISVGAEVVLLRRTEKLDWFNVLYFASTGNEILGWIEAENLANINYLGNAVTVTDLPITQFEWNSRDDIRKLMKPTTDKIGKNGNRLILKVNAVIFLSICVFFCVVGVIAGQPDGRFYDGIGTTNTILVVSVGVLCAFLAYRFSRSIIKDHKSLYRSQEYARWQQLQLIEKAKKPASQQAFEDDLKRSAISAAMQIGVNAATRFVPDRKNISLRN